MTSKQFALLERRKQVAERYLRLQTQWEIARALGIGQKTVSRDLHVMREEWLACKEVAIDQVLARELAKIDHLERTYWEGYERSRAKKETKAAKKVGGKSAREESSLREEGRDGDTKWLQGIERCIRLRAEILGIIGVRDEITDGKHLSSERAKVVEDADWFGRGLLPPSTPGAPAPSSN